MNLFALMINTRIYIYKKLLAVRAVLYAVIQTITSIFMSIDARAHSIIAKKKAFERNSGLPADYTPQFKYLCVYATKCFDVEYLKYN